MTNPNRLPSLKLLNAYVLLGYAHQEVGLYA